MHLDEPVLLLVHCENFIDYLIIRCKKVGSQIKSYFPFADSKKAKTEKKFKDDAVPIVIAMGTPGDKAGSIEEVVVKTEPDLTPPAPGPHQPPPPRIPLFPSPTHTFSVQHTLSSSEQSLSTEMGVIDRLPTHFPAVGSPPTLHVGAKPEALRQIELEQSTIEHYYVQTKYYPDYQLPSTSYTLTSKSKSFLSSSDQPGPSGLQTPKSKSVACSASHGRLKRVRKPPTQDQQGTPQPRKTYQCPYCKKSFTTSDKLDKHEQTHSGSSPFKCDNCKKIFTSKFKLVRHALIHSDRKPFSCSVCDRTFHRKDHLKNHIKVHSPQKDVYICENCKKQYTSLLSYRKHLALHAAEEGNLTCQICHDIFDSKEKILFHLKIHAGSRTVKNPNEKKFKCEECGRRFFTRKDVRRHNVVHTGMRDFLCQYCPQRFGRKDHLVRHIKKSHNNKYKAEETITSPTIKTEPKETSLLSETSIKSEFPESSISNAPETFTSGDLGLPLIEGDLTPFLESENLLTPGQEELKDLGSIILEGIESAPTAPGMLITENIDASQGVLDEDEVLLNNPELLLLETAGDKNLPLPGFSQTFQSPPPPGPPQ